ncbi:flavin reductase [Lutimonas sp.]|uniref:flavin reductase n=1 Tax=Lutimonas sp. TaxID=1872403 RepID=UPI003D9BF042
MQATDPLKDFISLELKDSIWEHFYTVAPLVVIGSKESQGFDLAPKHMATPLGFSDFFGFVCTARHNTYQNIKKHSRFSVSFVKPDQILLSSLAAIPRCAVKDFSQEITNQIPTLLSEDGEVIFVQDSYVMLDCALHQIIDGFDDYSIITGRIRSARVHKNYKIVSDEGHQKQIYDHPLLAYIAPGRFANIHETLAYPYPKDFQR